MVALAPLRTRREQREAALVAMKAAARTDKRLRWSVFALTLRVMSPLKISLCLVLASVVLAAAARCQGWWGCPVPGDSAPSFAYEDEVGVCPKLKLERDLIAH